MASDSSAAAFGGLWPPDLWRPLGSPQQLKSQPKSSRWFKPAIGVFSSTSTSASSRFIFVLNANPPPLKFCTGASSSSSSLSAQAGVCDGSSSSAYDAACLCVSLALQGQTQELRYREIHVRPPAVGKEDSKRNAPFVIECETPEHSKRLMEVLDGLSTRWEISLSRRGLRWNRRQLQRTNARNFQRRRTSGTWVYQASLLSKTSLPLRRSVNCSPSSAKTERGNR